MHLPNARSDEGEGRALYLIGLTVLLVTFLVALSAILGRSSSAKPAAAPPPSATAEGGGGGGGKGGGGGMVHMFPGAPCPITPVGRFPDGPSVTIVEDVRDTMHRLPLDRNHPKGWTNPSVKKPRKR